MSKLYTFILRDTDGTGSDNSSLSYFVNWESILPVHHMRYKMTTYLRGYGTAVQYMLRYEISNINTFVWDSQTQGKSAFVGIAVQQYAAGSGTYFFFNPAVDIEGLMVDRTFPSTITVKVFDSQKNAVALTHYELVIQLEPIDEKMEAGCSCQKS